MQQFHDSFKAIGTLWNIDIKSTDNIDVVGIFNSIHERVAEFEETYSRFKETSLIQKIARKAGAYDLPVDAIPMFDLYRKLYEITEGKMTPLIGQALVDAGYDTEYSLTPKETIRTVPKWDDVMEYKDGKLIVHSPIQLDMGAIGKGYCIDIVSEMLLAAGIKDFVVDAGGDMRHHASTDKTLRVALENAKNTTQAVGIAEIKNQSICGSSGNRRAWNKYTHIIDPDKLESPREIAGLWVTADTTIVADALTTALFFTPAEKLLQHFSFEYVILYSDDTIVKSQNFPGELFA